ncbi:GreA/GreB family elongation factor [Pseudomonas sp. RIT-PI-AD]|uniref:GreA/GreB family elongation factor n=1 Tax=Pseudomonas sp. RIT-PI-AD TaxID=3035294 RepID=UPI0021D8602D|nr:GreA/GreB family elongation factor [Pseudomonas sp. RIT-PI-AD]
MPKDALPALILAHLQVDLEHAQHAARTAYEAATHEENIAENKYDTLGLEASYLATGQARRADEIRRALASYRTLQIRPCTQCIQLTTLVTLADAQGDRQQVFLGPDAAGLTLRLDGQEVRVITPHSPLGAALLGKREGDEVELSIGNRRQFYEVLRIA